MTNNHIKQIIQTGSPNQLIEILNGNDDLTQCDLKDILVRILEILNEK